MSQGRVDQIRYEALVVREASARVSEPSLLFPLDAGFAGVGSLRGKSAQEILYLKAIFQERYERF